MGFALTVILAWFGFAALALAILHGRALAAMWREPVFVRPVLIVESDDWGPGPRGDAAVLREIAETLSAVRDRDGRPAVMTLGVVGGIPDVDAMRAAGFAKHVRCSLLAPDFAPVLAAMGDGCRAGVFAVQRHGLEHYWPAALLARLHTENGSNSEALRRWLEDGGLRSEALPPPLQSRWVDCASLPSVPLDPVAVDHAVREESDLLQQLFGCAPEVAVPNTFVWNDSTERAWAAHGVRTVVTPGWRYEGRDAAGRLLPPARRIRNGESGQGGIIYVVRDAYFEPLRGHRAEDVAAALARKCAEGRPLLLETHRENFIGPQPARAAAVAELRRALGMALSMRPDLCFTTTAELATILRDPASPLRAQRWKTRLAAWFVRLRNEPDLTRLLKYSGLAALLGAAAYFLGDVTYRRSARAGRC